MVVDVYMPHVQGTFMKIDNAITRTIYNATYDVTQRAIIFARNGSVSEPVRFAINESYFGAILPEVAAALKDIL